MTPHPQNTAIMVTAKAPVNIAVIKYWGKRDEELLLPLNDSISATLSKKQMCAETTVSISPSYSEDVLWLNGKKEDVENVRVQNCIREVRKLAREKLSSDSHKDLSFLDWHMHICSRNNFPTAAGLASSAAGYACLVYTLGKVYGIENEELSCIARQGSGSACRSIYGGFVQWHAGIAEDGTDSIAKQLSSDHHWPEMHVLVLVVNSAKKATASTSGMGLSVKTSDLLKYRVSDVLPQRVEEMSKAIREKNFSKFAEITMKDSNQFHAICQDTYPPIRYMNETSWAIVDLVHQYNSFYKENKVAYTFDAGPNACLFMEEGVVAELVSLICLRFPPLSNNPAQFCVGLPLNPAEEISRDLMSALQFTPISGALQYMIHTKVGSGPEVSPSHLLDEGGLPKVYQTEC